MTEMVGEPAVKPQAKYLAPRSTRGSAAGHFRTKAAGYLERWKEQEKALVPATG